MNIAANFIAILHLLFIVFVTTTPFVTENTFILLYYCFILFFVMVHWYLNNDTCVLTIIESKLRGKRDTETFMGKLIKPIYNISSKEIHYIAILLFIFALAKSQIWKKETYDMIYRAFYIKYKLISNHINSIKYDNNPKNIYNNEVINFIANPLL